MNDMDILREAWADCEPPADTARTTARAAVLARAEGREPARRRGIRLPRFGVRLVAVGAMAMAAAVTVTVVQTGGGTDEHGRPHSVIPGIPAGPVANASQALERAALAAESRPFTPPRPDQWIYIESTLRKGARPNGPVSRDPHKTLVERSWKRADGKKSATVEDGKLVVSEMMPTTPPTDYASLIALPTDPSALLQRIYEDMGGLGETPEGRYSTAYSMLSAVLRESVLPPKNEAAVFRAIKQIPGVTLVKGRVDAAGRQALGLGRVTEGWLHEELLLDPATYAYLGERSVAIKDHTSRGVDTAVPVQKGDLLNITVRVKAGIVDKAGQRP